MSYTVTAYTPFAQTPAELSRLAAERQPDASYDEYGQARDEALTRSFLRTTIGYRVLNAQREEVFAALSGNMVSR